jgi:hypothetical protein
MFARSKSAATALGLCVVLGGVCVIAGQQSTLPGRAVVTGRVVNEAAQPLRRVLVQLLTRAVADRRVSLRLGPLYVTDDDGKYRIEHVSAGRYLIAVARANQYKDSAANGYPTVFYPGVTSAARATEIALAFGDTREGIDFRLESAPPTRVSGTLTGLELRGPRGVGASGLSLQVHLIPEDSPDTPLKFGEASTWSAGEVFAVDRIRPGRYLLRVADFPGRLLLTGAQNAMYVAGGTALSPAPAEPTLWAEMKVEVADRDLSGVTVALQRGVRVSGRVVFEGGLAPQPDRLLGTVVGLQTVDERDFGDSPIVRIEADGRFTTVGMPPGRYAIGLFPMKQPTIPLAPFQSGPLAWRVSSIRVGERTLDGNTLDIGAQDVQDVVITLTPNGK